MDQTLSDIRGLLADLKRQGDEKRDNVPPTWQQVLLTMLGIAAVPTLGAVVFIGQLINEVGNLSKQAGSIEGHLSSTDTHVATIENTRINQLERDDDTLTNSLKLLNQDRDKKLTDWTSALHDIQDLKIASAGIAMLRDDLKAAGVERGVQLGSLNDRLGDLASTIGDTNSKLAQAIGDQNGKLGVIAEQIRELRAQFTQSGISAPEPPVPPGTGAPLRRSSNQSRQ